MGYCTRQELIQALANALSQGSPTAPGQLVDIINVGNMVASTTNDQQIHQYIKWADENIDAYLSSLYKTPFGRINLGSYSIAMDVTAGDTQVILQDATRFTEEDVVLIRDDVNFQQLTIATIPNDNTLTFTGPIINSYVASNTNIERIRYPDPIPKTSARLAAAYLFDKHFAAQQDGNQSDYGKELRRTAFQDINLILAGTVRLAVPDASSYRNRRYYNQALDSDVRSNSEPKEWLKQS